MLAAAAAAAAVAEPTPVNLAVVLEVVVLGSQLSSAL
ncbi:hypothetical protein V462_25315 [Pantoea ananatis 15320]|nr:hypothetical protein V462_25315 [Pantoea ananatis 15320]